MSDRDPIVSDKACDAIARAIRLSSRAVASEVRFFRASLLAGSDSDREMADARRRAEADRERFRLALRALVVMDLASLSRGVARSAGDRIADGRLAACREAGMPTRLALEMPFAGEEPPSAVPAFSAN